MAPSPSTDKVLLVLSPSPLRAMMGGWLRAEGFDVDEVPAWDVDAAMASDAVGVVVTSEDLDGEWGWSTRHGTDVLVLGLPRPGPRVAPA